MTSLAGFLYPEYVLHNSVAAETDFEASRRRVPKKLTTSLMEHDITAGAEGGCMSSPPNISQLLMSELFYAWRTQDTQDDSDVENSDSDATSSETSYDTSDLTSGGSGSSDSRCTSSYSASNTDDSDTTSHDRSSTWYEEDEGSDQEDDETEEAEMMVGNEAPRINGNLNSNRRAMGNLNVIFSVSRNTISPEQRGGIIVASSVSTLPSFTVAGASSSHFSFLLTDTREKKMQGASGSVASMVPPAYTTTTLNPKLSMPYVFSTSDTFSNWLFTPLEDQPNDLGKDKSGKTGARRPQSAVPHNSGVISQMYFSNDHGCHTSDQKLSTLPLGDEKRLQTASVMHIEAKVQNHTPSNRIHRNEDSVIGHISSVWSNDDGKSESAMLKRASVSNVHDSFPSFMAYFPTRPPRMAPEEMLRASSAGKRGETLHKTSADGGPVNNRDYSSSSPGKLPHCSSFSRADTSSGGSPAGEVFCTVRALSPNAIVRVLRGDFDNRDISLDSRLFDADHHQKVESSRMEAKGPFRQRSASSGYAVTAGGVPDRHGTSTTAAGNGRTSSSHRVDASGRRRASDNLILSVLRGAPAGCPCESFSVTRSFSSGQVQSPAPVPSQQMFAGGWRLLSFREQDDTLFTNIEHVPHNGKSKKKHKKYTSKRRNKHRKSRHAVGDDREGNGAGKDEQARYDVRKNENALDGAARMCQGRNSGYSPTGVAGVTGAGAAPTEYPTGVTYSGPSYPLGSAGGTQDQGSACSRVEVNAQPCGRQRAVRQDLVRRTQPLRVGTSPAAADPQIRMPPSRAPVRTVTGTPPTHSVWQSQISTTAKVGTPVMNTRVPLLSAVGALDAVNEVGGERGQRLDRFERLKDPPVASPSATGRRVTVRSGKSKVMSSGRKCSGISDAGSGVRRLRPASATRVLPSLSLPNRRIPVCLYGGMAACNGEPSRELPTRQGEGLPPL
uniref:Uncharacterized protein n=1 Tax=Leishmania guyanensis TaxID=5670 RepID=A0A1E1J5A3_LEIGU|nr:hypothetical protein, unknown function [Leishmania guyanensis]